MPRLALAMGSVTFAAVLFACSSTPPPAIVAKPDAKAGSGDGGVAYSIQAARMWVGGDPERCRGVGLDRCVRKSRRDDEDANVHHQPAWTGRDVAGSALGHLLCRVGVGGQLHESDRDVAAVPRSDRCRAGA